MVPTPQATNQAKTSIGIQMNHESILIVDMATDEDGRLKIKRVEEFVDSKLELDFIQAIAGVGAKK